MQPYFTIQTFVINLFRNGYISNIMNFQCENERRETILKIIKIFLVMVNDFIKFLNYRLNIQQVFQYFTMRLHLCIMIFLFDLTLA